MGRRPDPRRCHVDLAGIGLGVGDELWNRLSWNRWIYHHDIRCAHEACDRRDVADEVEIEFIVERRIDCVRCTDEKKRMAVGRRAHDRLGGDVGASPRSTFDDEWLTELLRQPVTQQARYDVGRAARGKAYDPTHRPRRIVLRPCDAWYGRECGSAGCQM